MANQKHLDLLRKGREVWNEWMRGYPDIRPDLSNANLSNANLSNTNLWYADLSNADLSGADLSRIQLCDADLSRARFSGADLRDADLTYANLYQARFSAADNPRINFPHLLFDDFGDDFDKDDFSAADLSHANLSNADLRKADFREADLKYTNLSRANFIGADLSKTNLNYSQLRKANLTGADLTGADLTGADLSRVILIRTNLTNTILKECTIYGISAWDVQLEGAEQLNLTITPYDQPTITVDNLKIAQFIYLLLNNAEIRDVIDTLTTKSVLILGRFSRERKPVLDALRETLRSKNYLPILFDFENPKNRDVAETVRTLAHLARFILADLTDPSSIPFELGTIVSDLEVPLQPLLFETKREFSMFVSLTKYEWVLPIHKYEDLPSLLKSLENLLASAEKKVEELAIKKARRLIR